MKPPPDVPRYTWAAFHNVYNYTLLGGAAAASALTLNPLPLLVALGAEGLWLSMGTLLPPFRKRVERHHQTQIEAWQAAQLELRLNSLPADTVHWYQKNMWLAKDIQDQAATSPRGALLAGEIRRLQDITEGGLDLAEQVFALEQYLVRVNMKQLQASLTKQEQTLLKLKGPAADLASQNLVILKQRMAKLQKMEEHVEAGREQMKLLTNSLQLVRDELMTPDPSQVASPSLENLWAGLNSARETLRELGRLAEGTGEEQAAEGV